jgi:hypothetical protein
MLRPDKASPAVLELLGSVGADGVQHVDVQADRAEDSRSYPAAPLPRHVRRLPIQPAVRTAGATACAETTKAYAADLRFERNVAKLHAFVLWLTAELLRELGANIMQMTWIEPMLQRYARMNPAAMQARDSDRCPRLVLREVRR